ncbi:MAG TPA: hypothetical protein VEK55_12615 [Xanthobacteraceae bacterium]|nr:hypothetical protein [Xanthobacteraceae bacterium]
MSQTFKIPKQTDRAIIRALDTIRADLKPLMAFTIEVQSHDAGQSVQLPDANPDKLESIKFILDKDAQIMPLFHLKASSHAAIRVQRVPDQITDNLITLSDQAVINQFPQDRRSQIIVTLVSSACQYLKTADVDASLSGGSDSAWTRYRDSQQAILSSLEQTQRAILEDFTRKALELETSNKSRLEVREAELQQHFSQMQHTLTEEHQARLKKIEDREAEIVKREKSFNTKEARYVARQEQQNQIEEIKRWLEGWSLTRGTRSKRYVVSALYAVGVIATLVLTLLFSYQTIEVFRIAAIDLSKVSWWQWLLLSFRPLLSLAAFITFLIYFIRWSSAWARQHADEEFRNRARVLDIGRSAWLLEAVRDAQENQKELPSDLVKELSRNLFAYTPSAGEGDLHPEAISEILMQGLNSLRVKAPDGTEVEAKRGKG